MEEVVEQADKSNTDNSIVLYIICSDDNTDNWTTDERKRDQSVTGEKILKRHHFYNKYITIDKEDNFDVAYI